MRTKDLIALLERNGWVFKRHGSNHDIYVKGRERESIVRHKETDEDLAKSIIKRRGIEITPSKSGGSSMKAAYPIILRKGASHIVVDIPDFNINTQGTDYADAMEMARDAIGLMGIDMEDDQEPLPIPSNLSSVPKEHEADVVTLVDVDFTEYRRRNDLRTVRRNVSLPSWLNAEAERAGINVSALLQSALKNELHIAQS